MSQNTQSAERLVQSSTVPLNSGIAIGSLTCKNRVFLAPMSGVTDIAFRNIAWQFGAGLVFSEMVASEALVTGKSEMQMKSLGSGLPIHAVQIAGRQAKWMELAAKMAQENGADLIDINMGCPSRRVTSGLSGSALMQDLDHALSLIDSVVNAVNIPVTLKMRLGWDENSINAPQLAARAQSAGIAMISVHGRTRCQFYKGQADWKAINKVREQTTLPLIVNGDIIDASTAATAMKQSQGDGVMVGRGSYGAPWLPGQIANFSVQKRVANSPQNLSDLVQSHLDSVLSNFGKTIGIRQFRKHLGWYLDKHMHNSWSPEYRRSLMTSVDVDYIFAGIKNAFGSDGFPVSL